MAPKAEERYFCKHRSRSLYWFRRLPSPLLLCRSVSINTRHDFVPSRKEAPVLSRYERLPPLLLLARFRRRGGDTVCTTTARKVLRRGQRTRLSLTGRSRPRRGPRRSLSWRRRRSEKMALDADPSPEAGGVPGRATQIRAVQCCLSGARRRRCSTQEGTIILQHPKNPRQPRRLVQH